MTDIETVEKFIFDELACRVRSADPMPDLAEEDGIAEAKAARLALRSIKESRDAAIAEAAACIGFLETELGWEDFRAEGFIGRESVTAYTKNCQKLAAFLKDRGNHGVRFLAEFEAILGPEVVAERNRQDAQWGGPSHDDEHDRAHWTEFMGKFLHRAFLATISDFGSSVADDEKFEANMLKVQALAIAAVRSSRRKR